MRFLNAFNQVYGKSRNGLIQKALTSATGSGEALIREQLERIITNTAVRLSPLIQMLDVKYKKGKFSEFNRLTSLPSPGSAMGEGATTPTRQSAYARVPIQKKIMRRKAGVTDFLADTAADDFDAIGQEIEHHIQSKVYDLEFYSGYGNAISNQYEHDGFEAVASTNYIDRNAVLTTKMLDDMLDATRRKQNAGHRLGWLMSPEMNSKLSQLQTNVRINEASKDVAAIDAINAGIRLEHYRKVPIVETGAMRPNKADTGNVIGTVSPSTSTTGGTIAADTYYFSVAPIGYDGVQLASAEATQITTGTTSTITLTWAAVPNALQYRIYAGTTTGLANHLLVRIISAFTYDGDGTITGSTVEITLTTPPLTPGSEVPTHMQTNVPLVEVGGVPPEMIMMIDFDRFQGIGGYDYTNPSGAEIGGLISVEPLAKVDAKRNFLLTTEGCLIPAFEATSAISRRVRVA